MRAALVITAAALAIATPAIVHAQPFTGRWTTDDGATGRGAEHTVELDLWRDGAGAYSGTARYFLKGTGAPVCTARLRQTAVDTISPVPTLDLVETGCGSGLVRISGAGDEATFSRTGGAARPGAMEQQAVRTGAALRTASSVLPRDRTGRAPPQVLRLGRAVRGRLERGDSVAPDRTLYDDYLFTTAAPVRLRVTMRAAEFDAYLIVALRGSTRVVRDDDGGGGTDARVELDVPAGGTVLIRANALGQGMQGDYTLELSEG